jgi:hypothetical protein
MNTSRTGKPSPAFFVAVFALLVAMSGTGYAVSQLPKHSVGTKQLKKQAVTTEKLAPNAVTSGKVAGNTLKGADIKESTLAKVPDAAHADSATTATKANSAANADALQGHGSGDFVSSGAYKHVVLKLQAGEEKVIASNGPLSIYARCATTGPDDTIRIYAASTVDGAILHTSWGDSLDGTNAGDFLNQATPEADREWENQADIATNVTGILDRYDDSHVIAPGGQAISWESEAQLLAFNYLGARCLIAGDVHLWNLG